MKVTLILLWPVNLKNPNGESLFLFPGSNKIIFQSWHGRWSIYSPLINISRQRGDEYERRELGRASQLRMFQMHLGGSNQLKSIQMLDLSTADSFPASETPIDHNVANMSVVSYLDGSSFKLFRNFHPAKSMRRLPT